MNTALTGTDTQRWDAVRRRAAGEGFIFGVRTTRIACRPGCPARTPSPENVVFFDDFGAALAAGYRACKRCAPDDVAAVAARHRLVKRAIALLDASEAPSLDEVARTVGLSRFHFQRIFRGVTGVTPGEYRRARRAERLRDELHAGAPVTEAIHAAGYGSTSRAYENAALGMTPSAFRSGGRGERIAFALAPSTLGTVLVARTARGICAIELGDDDEALVARLRGRFPHAELTRDDEANDASVRAALAIVNGCAKHETLDLDLRGTVFQRRVWNALRAIPAGERRSYADVAAALGHPGAARAVAAACASNAHAVAIPCHRVVGRDGALRGYRWGIARKAALLQRERKR